MGRIHETSFSPKRAQAFETGAPVNTAVCRTFRVCYVQEPGYQTRWTKPTRSFEDGKVALGDPSRKHHRGGDGRQSFPSAKRSGGKGETCCSADGWLLRKPVPFQAVARTCHDELPFARKPPKSDSPEWLQVSMAAEDTTKGIGWDATQYFKSQNCREKPPAAGQTLPVKSM